jgi:acetyl-CoA synthase
MSDVIAGLTVEGYQQQLNDTKAVVEEFRSTCASGRISFPDTTYHLPLCFGLTKRKISSLPEVEAMLSEIESRNGSVSAAALDLAGIVALGLDVIFLQELKKAMEASLGREVNFIPDTVLRSLGVQLVSGDIVGIAVVIGPAPDEQAALDLVRSLQEKNILTVLAGSWQGQTMQDQLKARGVEMTLDTFIVWLGPDTESVVLALNWAVRAALTFGGIEGGQKQECLDYCARRVPAFALALAGVDAKRVATAAGAIALGFPVVAALDVPEICIRTEQEERKLLASCPDISRLVETAIDIRRIKVKTTRMPIPVRYGSAFEGERVRKENVAIEFGGRGRIAMELVTMAPIEDVENHRITVTGPEIDGTKPGELLDLAVIVRVAGTRMQKDFESILERQIHHFTNCAMGIMHTGQRDLVRIRISKAAKEQGFKFRHLGEILFARLISDYGMIVDKVEIEILTDPALVGEWIEKARSIYQERDQRIGAMTDESVDVFYSCTLCQSFAPNHVCIITPERLGLCGAYNWLDGKAAHSIMPTGPNQPVRKEETLDAKLGQWAGVNEFVHSASNGTLERFSAYSLILDPMTSCGCFECIVAILPGTGGFMVVDRTYAGMTPCGMSFSTLAGIVGGGRQSPGFIGIGANYLVSKKFLTAEDGVKRVVWMPAALKDRLREGLSQRACEAGYPDLVERICDETVTTEMDGLIGFLTERQHPALGMGELI